jgi:hypothetical protein
MHSDGDDAFRLEARYYEMDDRTVRFSHCFTFFLEFQLGWLLSYQSTSNLLLSAGCGRSI